MNTTNVVSVYLAGAEKYGDRNWERGFPCSLSMGALHRHLAAWWTGQDIDAETQCHHLAAVVFHALAMLRFSTTQPDQDDRPGHG